MPQAMILANNEANPEWVNYIQMESEAVSQLSESEIDNYSDRELYNPDMRELLHGMNEDGNEEGLPSFAPGSPMAAEASGLFGIRFRGLKQKIRKIICEVLGGFGDTLPGWDEIIKLALVALAAALGLVITGPWGVIILPIIVAIIAKVMKQGVAAVCNI